MIPLSARRLLPAVALLSALVSAPSVIAQSGYDPAAVGVQRPRQASQPRVPSAAEQQRTVERLRQRAEAQYSQPLAPQSAQTLQNLLYATRELSGNRYQVDGRQQARIEALRREMEKVAGDVMEHLSPQTQARYRDALDQAKRLDGLANTDYRDVDAYRARGGAQGMARETDAALRSLEDALLPMLQDVRAKLEQQARSRQGR